MSQADALPTNATEYTVSELSGALKRTVEDAFGNVRVRGEISGYRGPHASGHAYFALKDERSRLEAVIWRTSVAKLAFKPEEGLEVVATGRLTTYPGSSKYQIVIEDLKPAGAGALMALLNERRLRLEAEGLFSPDRKRPLPFMPRVVGVVTSPTGAVIRDICHRIADRFPVHVLVWPVRVQGETSAREVCEAIEGFNAIGEGGPIPRPDVILVARGGGSLEDLWSFNDEAVVRAATGSVIPLISAVGHETDWTLIDHASDRRAPTPTGAAEMAVPVRADLVAALAARHARHAAAISRFLTEERRRTAALSRALPSVETLLALPRRSLDEATLSLDRSLRGLARERRHRLDRLGTRIDISRLDALLANRAGVLRHAALVAAQALARRLADRRQQLSRLGASLQVSTLSARNREAGRHLAQVERRLERAFAETQRRRRERIETAIRVAAGFDPSTILARGYAIVRRPGEDQPPVTQAASLKGGERIEIEFSDGRRGAVTESSASTAASPRRRRSALATAAQDDLFG